MTSMHLTPLGDEPGAPPVASPGLLARFAALVDRGRRRLTPSVGADVAPPAPYDGPERRSGHDRRGMPRSTPDRRRSARPL